jgi:hypothetical protein
MSQTSARIISQAIAMAILNSRMTLTRAHVGQQVLLVIQGNGTFLSAAEQKAQNPDMTEAFDKYIYNTKANSQEAMARPENRKLLTEAVKAESAGDTTKASELYNQFLNAVQVSFNVIADRGRKFENGDAITAFVAEADTKSGHKAIVINDVRYKAPTAVEKVKFDISDLLAEEAPEDQLEEGKVVTK